MNNREGGAKTAETCMATRVDNGYPHCSLAKGHEGPHRAYESHDLKSNLLQTFHNPSPSVPEAAAQTISDSGKVVMPNETGRDDIRPEPLSFKAVTGAAHPSETRAGEQEGNTGAEKVLQAALDWNAEYKFLNHLSGDPYWVTWADEKLGMKGQYMPKPHTPKDMGHIAAPVQTGEGSTATLAEEIHELRKVVTPEMKERISQMVEQGGSTGPDTPFCTCCRSIVVRVEGLLCDNCFMGNHKVASDVAGRVVAASVQGERAVLEPGTWELSAQNEQGVDILSSDFEDRRSRRIATVIPWPGFEATANLMAAAPELAKTVAAQSAEIERLTKKLDYCSRHHMNAGDEE